MGLGVRLGHGDPRDHGDPERDLQAYYWEAVMSPVWVVIFRYFDDSVERVEGEDLSKLMEQARALFDRNHGLIVDFDVQVKAPEDWPREF